METNGSPKLVFGPDNDTDDYTQVIAYINEEFARIQAKEEKKGLDPVSDPVNDPVKSVDPLNSRELQVLEILKIDSSASRNDIAGRLQCSDSTVKRALAGLVRKGAIERTGSDKTGEWKIKI